MKPLVITALCLLPVSDCIAQEVDVETFYWARTTAGVSDNDILAANVGATWRGDTWSTRLGGAYGVRNEDWTGEYPSLAGVDLFRFRDLPDGRTGWSVALDWAEDRTTVLEGAWGRAWDRPQAVGRVTVGASVLADNDDVPGRDTLSPAAVGEWTWYPRDWAAIGAGMQVDDRGVLGALRTDLKLAENASFRLEWSYTENYYDFDGAYFNNDIRGGLFFTVPFDSLRERDARLPLRLTHRFARAQ